MKILALEHELPNITAEAFSLHANAEAKRVWELHLSGSVRELYFRADRTDAILVLECESIAEAHDVLGTLPFIQEGLITFELIPLRAYSGFERLFAPDSHS